MPLGVLDRTELTSDWRSVERLEKNKRLFHTGQIKAGHFRLEKDIGGGSVTERVRGVDER